MSHDRLPGWVAEATEIDVAEGDRMVLGDPALRELLANAVEPLDDEVEAVIRRAQVPRAFRPWPLLVAGLATAGLVVAVAVASWSVVPPADAPPTREVQHATYEVSAPVEATVDAFGTWLVQREGVVRYDVDPVPVGQRLVVRALDVEVEVVGTAFDIGIVGQDVWVEVLHGRVRVRHLDREVLLDPGTRWHRTPSPPVEAAPEPAVRLPPTVRPTLPIPPRPGAELAVLLERVEHGEHTEGLLTDLRAFASSQAGTPLGTEATIAALELSAVDSAPDVALAELDTWLSTNPSHPRRPVVLELRAQVAYERAGGCAVAAPTWDELGRSSSGDRRARALARSALCAHERGDPEVVALLRTALAAEPPEPLRTEVATALEALVIPDPP